MASPIAPQIDRIALAAGNPHSPLLRRPQQTCLTTVRLATLRVQGDDLLVGLRGARGGRERARGKGQYLGRDRSELRDFKKEQSRNEPGKGSVGHGTELAPLVGVVVIALGIVSHNFWVGLLRLVGS